VRAALILAALAAATAAHAHVVLEQKSAQAGSYYKGTFMVGHGCAGGSPTVAVTVKVPADILVARPSPKPGWTIEVQREPLAKPYESYGTRITERVAEVTWRGGPLAFDHYDEFVVLMRLPESAGRRHFAVRQQCVVGSLEWSQVPEPGQSRRELKSPAAELEVLPAAPAEGGHRH